MLVNNQQLQYAQSLHQQGRLAEALQAYQAIYSQDDSNIQIIQFICMLLVQMGDLQQARSFIKQGIKKHPQEASFYINLGNIYLRCEKVSAAVKAYRKALAINPNAESALNNLGNVYFRQQHYEQAKDCYQKAIHQNNHYLDAHFNLARVYIEQKNNKMAITHLQQVLQLNPHHAAAQGQLGLLLLSEGDFDKAIQHLQKRLALQPNHAETYQAIASAQLGLENRTAAIELLLQAIHLNPKISEAYHQLATAYLQNGHREQALMYYLRELEQGPHLESSYNIGVILSDQQRHDEAIHYFLQAISLDAAHCASHLNLAALYLKKGNLNKAIEHYQIVLGLNPQDPEIQHILHALKQNQSPAQAPELYIKHLFDQYAISYDKHLQEYLKYQVPNQMLQIFINNALPEKKSLRILDLGCGTGLSGEVFSPYAKEMIGVDLSENMLAIAQDKKIYNCIRNESIESALLEYNNLDLIIAADVFPYVGDLKLIFQRVFAALCTKGWFAFSIEKTKQRPYHLQKTIRYAHNKNYIEALAMECGFLITEVNNVVLREQQKNPLEGYLFILRK